MAHTMRETLFVYRICTCLAPNEGVLGCTMHTFVADGAVIFWARGAALFHRVRFFRGGSLASGTCICVSDALVNNGIGCRRRMCKYVLKL